MPAASASCVRPATLFTSQFLHHGLAVTAHRLQTEVEHHCDILAGLAFGHHAQHLQFAWRQRIERRLIVRFQIAALNTLQQPVGNLRAQIRLPPRATVRSASSSSPDDAFFRHESTRAAADGAHHRVLVVVHGEDHDLDAGAVAQQLRGGFDAVHAGQADIHQHQIGIGLLAELHGIHRRCPLRRPHGNPGRARAASARRHAPACDRQPERY